MKKKISVLVLSCALAFGIPVGINTANQFNITTVSAEEEKTVDSFDNPIISKTEETTEETKKETKVAKTEKSKISEVQKSIIKINNKFEIVKNIVGSDYENLDVLIEQIDNLNVYIDENLDKIVEDKTTETKIVESLDSVEDSLDKLLNTFNIELDDDNNFYEFNGTIKEINDDKITIENDENTYVVTVSDITLKLTDYKVNDEVVVKYSGSTTVSNKIMIDKCLSIVVPEETL